MRVGKSFAALAASVGLFMCSQGANAAIVIEQLAAPQTNFTNQTTTLTGNTGRAGETRLFLARKQGAISIYDQATNSYSVFNDLSARVVADTNNELGLLGLAFDPGYATNGQYYVYLTGRTQADGPVEAQVIRFTDPLISAGPEKSIWKMDLQGATNHVGGWIGFDAGGKLLIAIGDGGNGTAPDSRATGQNPGDWFGSILRIDPYVDDFLADSALNYGIPAGNLDIPGAADEVSLYGLRNPFRNSIAPDGNLIVADVGYESREELTVVGPGDANRNLGWALREGDISTPVVGGAAPSDYQAPDLAYGHDDGAAIIGGFVYRGSAVPELYGRYVFGDQVSGNIWSIAYENGQFVGNKQFIGNIPSLVAFGETADGELIATRFAFSPGGAIYRFASDGNAVPEPASWAMMIAGFAMAGGILRRRTGGQAARRLV